MRENDLMISLYDLRAKQDAAMYDKIQDFYKEQLTIIPFHNQSINACTGCWSCWFKTPGLCVMKDQMSQHYSTYVNSDTVILLMDTNQGFINHRAKAFFDRTIPHYHPYIELVKGECHHVARYKRYPNLVFYFDDEGLSAQEEQVIEDYLYRMAFHFKSKPARIVNEDQLRLQQLKPRNAQNHIMPFASTESIEKLVIYNGSPRRIDSNSSIILNKVMETLGSRVEVRDLKQANQWDKWAESFSHDQHVMFFMPLYVHAMPSHVMAFIEKLKPSMGSISFFVQSGFPESSQSYYVEAYFNLLASRLKRTYLGTAIKGGMEGLRMSPKDVQENMIKPLVASIEHLISEGEFNQTDLDKMAIPIRFGKAMGMIFQLLVKIGVVNSLLWDKQLKVNNAYKIRYNRPF